MNLLDCIREKQRCRSAADQRLRSVDSTVPLITKQKIFYGGCTALKVLDLVRNSLFSDFLTNGHLRLTCFRLGSEAIKLFMLNSDKVL